MPTESILAVKWNNLGEFRRFSLKIPKKSTAEEEEEVEKFDFFAILMEKIKSINPEFGHHLAYMDAENDLIVFSTNEELREVLLAVDFDWGQLFKIFTVKPIISEEEKPTAEMDADKTDQDRSKLENSENLDKKTKNERKNGKCGPQKNMHIRNQFSRKLALEKLQNWQNSLKLKGRNRQGAAVKKDLAVGKRLRQAAEASPANIVKPQANTVKPQANAVKAQAYPVKTHEPHSKPLGINYHKNKRICDLLICALHNIPPAPVCHRGTKFHYSGKNQHGKNSAKKALVRGLIVARPAVAVRGMKGQLVKRMMRKINGSFVQPSASGQLCRHFKQKCKIKQQNRCCEIE